MWLERREDLLVREIARYTEEYQRVGLCPAAIGLVHLSFPLFLIMFTKLLSHGGEEQIGVVGFSPRLKIHIGKKSRAVWKR